VKVIRYPFLNVKVACTPYRMMTSEVSQLAVFCSKLFEMAIIDRYSSYFVTSENQFGFKKNLGCRDAIYAVRKVIEHFVPTVQLSMSVT